MNRKPAKKDEKFMEECMNMMFEMEKEKMATYGKTAFKF